LKKIAVAMITTDLRMNGISTMMMNYCSNIDLNKFEIKIIAGKPIFDICEKRANQLGISIVTLPSRRTNTLKFYCALWKELYHNQYDIVHVHGNSATIADELLIAKLCGITIRIAHSHNTTCTFMRANKILFPLFKRLYTHGLACGKLAGQWLFRNGDFSILPNGFDTKRFYFDEYKREEERRRLGVVAGFVIGNIARFNEQKNHPFLLKIFEYVARIRLDAYLVLVGTGPTFNKIQRMIEVHPFKERIITYGETNETEKVYSAMDVFVLPSKFEGLVIALLEAQVSGLPCIVSDTITKETKIGENISFLSLDSSIEQWGEKIVEAAITNEKRKQFKEQYKRQIVKYDIRENVKELEMLYEKNFER